MANVTRDKELPHDTQGLLNHLDKAYPHKCVDPKAMIDKETELSAVIYAVKRQFIDELIYKYNKQKD